MFDIVLIGKFGVKIFKIYNCGFLSRILKKYLSEAYSMISVVSYNTGCAVFYIFPSGNLIKLLNPLTYDFSRLLIREPKIVYDVFKQAEIKATFKNVDKNNEYNKGYL